MKALRGVSTGLLALVLVAVLGCGLTACGGGLGSGTGGGTGTPGSGSGGTGGATVAPGLVASVQLTLGTASVATDGSAVAVRALIRDANGVPVPGVTVNFSSDAGALSATTATSDANGVAAVSLMPPTFVTSASVRADADGFSAAQTLTVVPGAVDPAHSVISADPSRILADGSSTSTITVLLADRYGNPQPDGRNVRLLNSAGLLVGGDTAQLASGRATFTLQSSVGAATAQLQVQDVPTLTTQVAFEAISGGDPASIRFAAAQNQISVTGVGQPDQTTITVTVLDAAGNPIDESAYGNPALNNLTAEFISRPSGGETLSGRQANGQIASTDASGRLSVRTQVGVAVLTLRSGTLSGLIEVRFSVLGFDGQTIAATAALPQVSIASGPPSTLVFSGPITNAITDLQNGDYRLVGKVDVTDRYGNTVPDGTIVNLSLMDSVILQDDTASTAAGSSQLGRSGPSQIRRRCATPPPPGGAEASGCTAPGADAASSDFSSTIVRNGIARGIQPGDLVLLANAADGDKKRTVNQVLSATGLETQAPYADALGGGQLWVGASLLGASIAGSDAQGNLTPGTTTTVDGIGEFRVTYPANSGTLLTGCYGYRPDGSYSDRDRRSAVPQSRQVLVAANAGQGATAVDVGDFCFKAVAGASLTPQQASLLVPAGTSATDALRLRDGGDTVPMPYVPVKCAVTAINRGTGSDFALMVSVNPNGDGDAATRVDGSVLVSVAVNGTATSPGDSATVTCYAADASSSFTVTPQ
jgi:Bacterial Ig-like domain (group 1).